MERQPDAFDECPFRGLSSTGSATYCNRTLAQFGAIQRLLRNASHAYGDRSQERI